MSKKEQAINEVLDKVDTNSVTSESEQVQEIIGKNFVKISASHSGKQYTFSPVCIADIPILAKKVQYMQDLMISAKNEGLDDLDALTKNDNDLLNTLSEILAMGIKEEITPQQVAKEFSMGDFPKCLEATLDMNDFLVGMRDLYQKRMRAA